MHKQAVSLMKYIPVDRPSYTTNFADAMSGIDNEFEVLDKTTAIVQGDISITKLVLALNEKKIEVLHVVSKEESLEEYFFELIGGAENA